MLKRQKYMDDIQKKLALLVVYTKLSNSRNLNDINKIAENLFRDFLNLAFDYKLENTNFSEPNTPAIDLGDKERKIAFQVTSDNSIEKIKKTVESFIKHSFHLKYTRLIVLIIGDKKRYRDSSIGQENIFQICT